MKKIIIDTDMGDDIDDALAIVMALHAPQLEIQGITTVFRDAEKRAQMVELLLEEYGRKDIVIAKGASQPMEGEVDVHSPQFCILEKDCYRQNSRKEMYPDAVSYILHAMKEDKDIAMAAIAPLTNLGYAILQEPEVFYGRELYLMGGMYSYGFPEWNIYQDVKAADIVFRSGMHIYASGLDVTLQSELTEAEEKELFRIVRKQGGILQEMAEVWKEGAAYRPILHDVLPLASLIDASLITYEEAAVAIEMTGTYTKGMTVPQKNIFPNSPPAESNCYVAASFDRARMMELFWRAAEGK